MKTLADKNEAIRQLKAKIMELEGFSSSPKLPADSLGLGAFESAFPGGSFPLGTVHEFISLHPADAASTNGFISGLLASLVRQGGFCLWVSNRRSIFPPGLKRFGIAPERVIFIDLKKEKDVLWAMELGLKCSSLSAVVGELQELSFTESQRLQLAVEQSKVTGLLHRHHPKYQHALACTTRWKIVSLGSHLPEGMPGVGFPTWQVSLLKVRNGRPGEWKMEWKEGRFQPFAPRESRKQVHLSREQHYA
ncbi:Error-prone repair protein ImuA [Algoriphagus sp. H41]|uniref:Error-prone repair protein ImuA n=1 Tax=Algoriphagus oliviformis TaxID=2811231 RepID=A0ABS3C2L3_9BACT|nr:Error-prone repair protein ImuA [Algoriphagus oliviformis]MBN7811326.1 Error-prone repair protein ImuA [Algoriphagus oliviformis]